VSSSAPPAGGATRHDPPAGTREDARPADREDRSPAARPKKGETLRSAPVPRAPAPIGYLGMFLAFLVLSLGLLAAYEAMVLLGWLPGDPILSPLLGQQAVVSPDVVTTVIGVVAALVGLWLLWTALRRGRRRGVELDTVTGVWMTHRDLERLAAGTAEDVDGVLEADANASRRKVGVRVETTSPEVRDHVRAAVTERLSGLSRPPKVSVTGSARHEGDD
jgi:hypothetical protein